MGKSLFAKRAAALLTLVLAGPALAYEKADCEAISQRAQKNGTKVMVIGVEGLLQIDPISTARLQAENDAIKAGKKPEISNTPYQPNPLVPVAQAGVTRGLLLPLVRKQGMKIEPLVFGEADIRRGSPSMAQTCAEIWMKVPGRKLILVGHSFGGPGALDLAANLKGIDIDALYTIDPVERGTKMPSKPANVAYMANYWQDLGRPGQSIPSAQHDEKLTTYVGKIGLGHMNIPGHPAILQDVETQIAYSLGATTGAPRTGPAADGLR